MDYTSGDLYEAEEIYQQGHPFEKNRVLFIHYPDGEIVEPIKTVPGQYLGRPIFFDGKIINLLADFPKKQLEVTQYEPNSNTLSTLAVIPLTAVKDCYNLMLHGGETVLLTRSGGDGHFEIIWPFQVSVEIGNSESFTFLKDNKLYFQAWYDEPAYHEEIIVRDIKKGTILDRFPGSYQTMPNGENWLLV